MSYIIKVNDLNQDWMQRSEKTLKRLRQLTEASDQDRLDLVRAMRFAFGSLGQSLAGWMQWINSPEIMSNFNRDELQEMVKTISGMVEGFIDYDVKITQEGMRKGLAKRRDSGQVVRFVI